MAKCVKIGSNYHVFIRHRGVSARVLHLQLPLLSNRVSISWSADASLVTEMMIFTKSLVISTSMTIIAYFRVEPDQYVHFILDNGQQFELKILGTNNGQYNFTC